MLVSITRTVTMRHDPKTVIAQQTRRAASTGGGVIRASAPEGLGGALHPHCGAVAGKSLHAPMT
ncbi:hypothetical protein [Polaromonas sp. CG_23.6]|uniref:hypothetical protein n=1 Tax=Polaromonas sp. CG_23.6 TaxID=2760709 RepID=UPI0024735903|nr:hypothetical protein [Polaromonas sp. CG_23.6]